MPWDVSRRSEVTRRSQVKLSVATRIFLAFAVMVVTFSGVLSFSIYQMQAIYDDVALINGGYVPLSLRLHDVKTDYRTYNVLVGEQEWETLRRTLSATQRHYDFPEQIQIKLERTATAVENLRREPQDERTSAFLRTMGGDLEKLLEAHRSFRTEAEAFTAAVLAEDYTTATRVQAELRSTARKLESQARVLAQNVRGEIDTSLLRAQQSERHALGAALGLSVFALLLSAGVLLLTHVTLRPLRLLTDGVKRIAGGDYTAIGSPYRSDEIGQLAEEFDKMAVSLAERDASLRSQQEALIKSERLAAVGEIASKVTHELRNPLSTIQVSAELLIEELSENGLDHNSEPHETLRSIIGEVERLEALTENYLRFARLPDPDPRPGQLAELVDSVLDFQRDELDADGIVLRVDLDPSLPDVHIDAPQFRRAILNLMRNAREALEGRAPQVLEIRTFLEADQVCLSIRDTGGGIPQTVRDRIFDPFFSTKPQGTGLGLPLVQQIVHEHGGTIDVESAQSGTQFTVRLPAIAS
jgi:signal transduction histidine kinase